MPPTEQAAYHCEPVVVTGPLPSYGVGPPVGLPHNRFFAHAQYAYASHQSTCTTGKSHLGAAAGQPAAGTKLVFQLQYAGCPVVEPALAARNAAYCALVTSVASIDQVPNETSFVGVGEQVT